MERLKALEKEKRKRRKEEQKRHDDNIRKKEAIFISRAYQIAAGLGIENFKIISIRKKENGYTIFYISDLPQNDWYEFRETAFAMNKAFSRKFTLKHTKLPDGSYAVI